MADAGWDQDQGGQQVRKFGEDQEWSRGGHCNYVAQLNSKTAAEAISTSHKTGSNAYFAEPIPGLVVEPQVLPLHPRTNVQQQQGACLYCARALSSLCNFKNIFSGVSIALRSFMLKSGDADPKVDR